MAVKALPDWHDISMPLKQAMSCFPTGSVSTGIYRYHIVEWSTRITMSMLEVTSHTGAHKESEK